MAPVDLISFLTGKSDTCKSPKKKLELCSKDRRISHKQKREL